MPLNDQKVGSGACGAIEYIKMVRSSSSVIRAIFLFKLLHGLILVLFLTVHGGYVQIVRQEITPISTCFIAGVMRGFIAFMESDVLSPMSVI